MGKRREGTNGSSERFSSFHIFLIFQLNLLSPIARRSVHRLPLDSPTPIPFSSSLLDLPDLPVESLSQAPGMCLAKGEAMLKAGLFTVAFTVSSLAGCAIDSGPGPLGDTPGTPPPSSNDLKLATVDTGATLTDPPGTGVGIFVEYQAGGHWHLWWTCDTTLSGLSCDFDVVATADSGSVSNVTGDRLESNDSLTNPNSTQVVLSTSTSTGVDGVFFDTDPGAQITVFQRIGASQDGSFFIWSQGGTIMGSGKVSQGVADPLDFVPSSP